MKVYKNVSTVNLFLSKNLSIFYLRTTFSIMARKKKISKIKL